MTQTNEAAERLRGGLEAIRDTSTDSASRQLADSLLALLAIHDGRMAALEDFARTIRDYCNDPRLVVDAKRLLAVSDKSPTRQKLTELTRLSEDLPGGYAPSGPPDEYMCPNCVTPWKCNGPHIPAALPAEWTPEDFRTARTVVSEANDE